MDFNAILQGSLPIAVANLTATGAGTATNNVVASLGSLLGPHFEPFLRLFTVVGELFGLDPIILPILGLLLAGRGLGAKCWHILKARFICSITCSSDDPICEGIEGYMSNDRNVKSRSFTLQTGIDDETPLPPEPGRYFNYADQKLNTKYVLIPGRARRIVPAGRDTQEIEEYTLSTFGSIRWLKAFVQSIEEECERSTGDGTVIRCLTDHRYHNSWRVSRKAPIRPLETVILGEQKEEIKEDMNEFLTGEDWYRQRGLAFRRGYIFHGPAGSGKSSLCAALAGFFGLDIYFVPGKAALDDDDLMHGFRTLPPRCIVLLEDVDAGFLKRDSGTSTRDKGGFSLSGLLNVLDGVAAPEGRIVIMTTNDIKRVDAALIRPGRVDKIVRIGHATKEQANELFLSIYGSGHDKNKQPSLSSEQPSKEQASKEQPSNEQLSSEQPSSERPSSEQLSSWAKEFAEKIPDHRISTASILCYLMDNKKDPERAVIACATWVEHTLTARVPEAALKEPAQAAEVQCCGPVVL